MMVGMRQINRQMHNGSMSVVANRQNVFIIAVLLNGIMIQIVDMELKVLTTSQHDGQQSNPANSDRVVTLSEEVHHGEFICIIDLTQQVFSLLLLQV